MKIKQHFQQRVVCFLFSISLSISLQVIPFSGFTAEHMLLDNTSHGECQLSIGSPNILTKQGKRPTEIPSLFLFFLLSECLRLTLIVMDSGTCVSKYRQKVAPGQWPPKTSLLFLLFLFCIFLFRIIHNPSWKENVQIPLEVIIPRWRLYVDC